MANDYQSGTENAAATAESAGILYGRKWLIQVFKPNNSTVKENDKGGSGAGNTTGTNSDIALDVSDLRCIFTAKYDFNAFVSIGTLVIYNLSQKTEKAIIEEGFQISIQAGYEKGQYGEIFTGDIIQVIRNREDGINYKLEILAARSIKDFDWNFVRSSIAANSTPREQIKEVCEKADTKLKSGDISPNISQQPLPRGKIFFGKPFKYLRDIAIHNNAFFGMNAKKEVTMTGVNDEIPEDMVVHLTPESGLVGTPKYTDNGIIIKMLLDARVQPRTLVKIDNSIIQGQLVTIDPQMNATNKNEQRNQKVMFDEDGEYMVLSVTHKGDTWGDEWTTEVVGLSRNGRAPLPTAVSSPEQSLQA